MHYWKLLCIFFVISLFTGCVTGPKLGYPVDEVEIPTKVTLFSTITKEGTIIQNMHALAKILWDLNYKKRFEEAFAHIPLDSMQKVLNSLFLSKAFSLHELFILQPAQVFNWDIEYSKTKEDPKTYCGFDFSTYKDTIPSQYILALTINEWGYMAQRYQDKEDGPHIILSIQLIDKETNESLWEFKELFQYSIGNTPQERNSVKIVPDFFMESYDYLLKKAVKYYFTKLEE